MAGLRLGWDEKGNMERVRRIGVLPQSPRLTSCSRLSLIRRGPRGDHGGTALPLHRRCDTFVVWFQLWVRGELGLVGAKVLFERDFEVGFEEVLVA